MTEVFQILCVDLNALEAEQVQTHLAGSAPHLHPHFVSTHAEALEMLVPEPSFDLVLIKLRLSGADVSLFIRDAMRRGLCAPILVLAEEVDESAAVAASNLGTSGYLVKHTNYERQLQHCIDQELKRSRIMVANRQLQIEIAELSAALGQKVAERTGELRESEDRFHALMEHSLQGIALIQDDRFKYVNSAWCAITGISEEARYTRPVSQQYDRVHPDDRARAFDRHQRMLHGQLVEEVDEVRILHVDGTWRWVLSSSKSFMLEGKPARLGMLIDVTERKLAEMALRQSEERYRRIVQTAEEGIWTIDAEMQTSFVNPKMAEMLGYTVEAMQGRPLADFMDEDGRAVLTKNVERWRRGISEQHDIMFSRKDGAPLWALLVVSPILDSAGTYAGALAMVTDISARKLAEVRVQQLNRTYAVLSDINQLIVRERELSTIIGGACRIAIDKGGFLMAWIGLLDVPTGELHLAAQAGASPDTARVVTQILRDPGCAFTALALATGAHAVCDDIECDPMAAPWREAALQRGYRAMASLPLTTRGECIGTLNLYAARAHFFDADELRLLDELALDIAFALESCESERQRQVAETALRQSEGLLRNVFETVALIGLMLDHNGLVTLCSDHLLSITGWVRDDVIGRNWFEMFLPPETREHVRTEVFLRSLQHGEMQQCFENEIITRRGERRLIAWRNSIVRQSTGEVVGVASLGEDITERRQLEEQLRQSQKMDAIGRLAGGVAHDFNNLLTVIGGNAALLQTDLADDERTRAINEIAHASDRAAALTRQLLTFSRRQPLHLQPLNLNDVVTGLARMLQRILGEDVQLLLHIHPSPLFTLADAGMLEQVLMNLVVNARDAMPTGGQIDIKTTERSIASSGGHELADASADRRVCLSVTDTGCGISPEFLPRIFEPFFTTKDQGKGVGLGLATVFGIVKQHGGMLDVASTVGCGSTFTITLPAIENARRTPLQASVTHPPPGGNECILVVEDEESVRRFLQNLLERHGYRVRTASTGLEAIKLWDQQREGFDLVLTDITMPNGVSGWELGERLLRDEPRLKLIYMSGYAENIRERSPVGQKDIIFLQKPCSGPILLEAVRNALDDRSYITP